MRYVYDQRVRVWDALAFMRFMCTDVSALVDLVLWMGNSCKGDNAGEVIVLGFNTFLGFVNSYLQTLGVSSVRETAFHALNFS